MASRLLTLVTAILSATAATDIENQARTEDNEPRRMWRERGQQKPREKRTKAYYSYELSMIILSRSNVWHHTLVLTLILSFLHKPRKNRTKAGYNDEINVIIRSMLHVIHLVGDRIDVL